MSCLETLKLLFVTWSPGLGHGSVATSVLDVAAEDGGGEGGGVGVVAGGGGGGEGGGVVLGGVLEWDERAAGAGEE